MCVSYSNDKISSLRRHPVPDCRNSHRLAAGVQTCTGSSRGSFNARSGFHASRGGSTSD